MSELYKKLLEYNKSDYYPFHMPGHKRKAHSGMPSEVLGIDITEIEGFDDLHDAKGILQTMQLEAAALYGADESFLLVNGSTGGILSAIAATAKKGHRLVMARNCHKSVYHAAVLQELKTAYLYPKLLIPYALPGAVEPKEVEELLVRYPDAAAVMITSPTYEGVVSDVEQIAAIVHRFQKPLIVDEAHGAHFGFHADFPETAVRLGADIVIQSMHKMLPAMTQTALLHVSGSLVDRERLKFYLRVFQTSSPSYVLMSSADCCLNLLRADGTSLLEALAQRRRLFDELMAKCRYIRILNGAEAGSCCMKAADPGKIVITADSKWMTGGRLYDMLEQDYHLQLEMAAPEYALALVTIMDGDEAFRRLKDALFEIDESIGIRERQKEAYSEREFIEVSWVAQNKTWAATTMANAINAEAEMIPLKEGNGRVSAEFIHLYPPGIPLITPGEKFNHTCIKKINDYTEMGLHVRGIGQNNHIKVMKKENRIR